MGQLDLSSRVGDGSTLCISRVPNKAGASSELISKVSTVRGMKNNRLRLSYSNSFQGGPENMPYTVLVSCRTNVRMMQG